MLVPLQAQTLEEVSSLLETYHNSGRDFIPAEGYCLKIVIEQTVTPKLGNGKPGTERMEMHSDGVRSAIFTKYVDVLQDNFELITVYHDKRIIQIEPVLQNEPGYDMKATDSPMNRFFYCLRATRFNWEGQGGKLLVNMLPEPKCIERYEMASVQVWADTTKKYIERVVATYIEEHSKATMEYKILEYNQRFRTTLGYKKLRESLEKGGSFALKYAGYQIKDFTKSN